MRPAYLALDTETTGVDEKRHQILTLAFITLREDFTECDHIELEIRHDEYVVQPGALAVNQIDLVKHHARALSLENAKDSLDIFFHGKPTNLIPIAHNGAFDLRFLSATFPGIRIPYRILDTCSIARAAVEMGFLPKGFSCKLEDLTKFFGIDHSDAHTALGDARAAVSVWLALKSLFQAGVNPEAQFVR